MYRREFIISTLAGAVAGALPWRIAQGASPWRSFEVTTRLEIQRPEGVSRAWVPLPLPASNDWHRDQGSRWTGNTGRAEVLRDAKYGVQMLYAEWPATERAPQLELVSRFSTRDRAIDLAHPSPGLQLSAAEAAFFTAPTELIPTDGIVRDTAKEVIKRARGELGKARAIYEWVVDNSFRDPEVRGCGWGDVKSMLESHNLGGKCADLNTLFVGLARAAGMPARDIYGIRVAPSAHYRSLGARSPVISKAQHCRAEFFAAGLGWVPVDPADVRKVVLEEPPGKLALDDPKVLAARRRLFGGWEMNWLAYNTGHDITLPHSRGPKLPYLMYPNGETGGERLDQLEPDAFKYTITAREIRA